MEAEIEHAFKAGREYNEIFESVDQKLNMIRSEYKTTNDKNLYRQTFLDKLKRIREGNYKQLTLIVNKYPIQFIIGDVKEIGIRIENLEKEIQNSN